MLRPPPMRLASASSDANVPAVSRPTISSADPSSHGFDGLLRLNNERDSNISFSRCKTNVWKALILGSHVSYHAT